MRMLVKGLSERAVLERPTVAFGLSPEAVYDGQPLLDVGQACLGPANGSSPSSGDYNERTRWQTSPDFTVPAVLGNGEIVDSFNLASAIKGKYGLVFFYPLDFTFVCPSELIALDNRIPDFQARNVEVIGVSIDSHFTHNAWRNTPVNAGGIGQVEYTLAADITHEICKAYDVESEGGVAFRGAF